MAEQFTDVGRPLSTKEEKVLDDKIKSLKDMRDGVEIEQGVSFEVKNKAALDQEISKMENIRQMNSISEVGEAEKGKYMREVKLLEEDLQRGAPTWEQYERSRPHDGPSHNAIVNWIVATQADKVRNQKVQRWKTLRRLLGLPSNTMFLFKTNSTFIYGSSH